MFVPLPVESALFGGSLETPDDDLVDVDVDSFVFLIYILLDLQSDTGQANGPASEPADALLYGDCISQRYVCMSAERRTKASVASGSSDRVLFCEAGHDSAGAT